MKHLPDTGKYLVFITRLFSMLWNTPFTCMSLPGELFFNNDRCYAYNDHCQGKSRLSYHSTSSLVTYPPQRILNNPIQGEQDTSASRRCPVRPVGAYFPIMTGAVYIIPYIQYIRRRNDKEAMHTGPHLPS